MKLADKLAFPAKAGGSPGMTLLEHYAGLMLQGMLANPSALGTKKEYAQDAVDQASALIKELEKTK